MAPIALLGPQRFSRTLGAAVRDLGVKGDLAVVTAGWQERELEDDELAAHLGGRSQNLRLYQRCEAVWADDPELFAAHRERQDRLRRLQEVYRLRLASAKAVARELLAREGSPDLLEAERRDAIAAVRALDEHHLRRVREVDAEFEARWRPQQRPAVAKQIAEVLAIVERVEAVGLAGGHVAILLNRLRLFGAPNWLAGRTIFAWSGGAMVLGERVVLFHDSPPQGAGNAEVLEAGLGLVRGVVPLPHARRRLRLADPLRVALFARRFAPALAVTLDDGARLVIDERGFHADAGARLFTPEGAVVAIEETA